MARSRSLHRPRALRSRLAYCGSLALLAGACAVPQRERVLADVQDAVHERLGADVDIEARPLRPEGIRELLQDEQMDADEAVRLAIANNPMLHAELAELEIARAQIWQASLAPNPVIDAQLRFAEAGGGDILELGVAQSIVDVLLIPRRRQVAAERLAQVEARVTGAVLDLATEVRANYRALQADQQLVELFEAATDAARLTLDATRRLREAGNVIELELLQEQAVFEDARLALTEARKNVRRHRENLNVLFGLSGPEGESWQVEGRMPEPAPLSIEPAELERRVVTGSLDLEAGRRELTMLGHRLGLEQLSAAFPTGGVGVNGEREASESWIVGGNVSLSLPVFDFGQAVSAHVRAEIEQAFHRLTDLAIRIRRSARDSLVASEVSGNNARHLFDVVVPLRTRITQQTQEQFNAMQIGVFRVVDAKRAELDAARRYIEELKMHWIARSQLESLLLGRLPATRFGITGPGLGSVSAIAGAGGNGGH